MITFFNHISFPFGNVDIQRNNYNLYWFSVSCRMLLPVYGRLFIIPALSPRDKGIKLTSALVSRQTTMSACLLFYRLTIAGMAGEITELDLVKLTDRSVGTPSIVNGELLDILCIFLVSRHCMFFHICIYLSHFISHWAFDIIFFVMFLLS